jgi:hypothetical protein
MSAADGLVESISNIAISKAQREVEQTPTGSIDPPVLGGSYLVDESVLAGTCTHKLVLYHLG